MNLFIDALSARNGGGITYIQNLLTYIPKDKRLKIYISYQGELISYVKDIITFHISWFFIFIFTIPKIII